jgi:phage terminase large subunit-like protein
MALHHSAAVQCRCAHDVGIIGNDRIVGIKQGWRLIGAVKTPDRKLADRTLHHGGHGLMAWAVGNARVEPKGNAIVITKQASGTAKIDPLIDGCV